MRAALILILLATVMTLRGADLFVDGTTGNDASSGRAVDKALKTIQKAAYMAVPGDKVIIRGGIYRETVRVKIAATAEQPVAFQPYDREVAVVSGADFIDSFKSDGANWKVHDGKIYSLELRNLFESKLNQSEQLFVDGRMFSEARHPSIKPGCDAMQPGQYFTIKRLVSERNVEEQNPWGLIGKGGARRVTVESDDLAEPDGAWDGASIWIKPEENQSWGFGRTGPVISYRKGLIEFDIYDRTDSFFKFAPGTRFFLFNKLQMLDAPGEWWIDRAARRIYLWIPGNDSPATHRIEMKRRDFAFDLTDSSHVTIQGLHIFGATISTDNQYGNGTGGGAWITHNRGSIDAPEITGNAKSHHVVLDGIRAQYVSHFMGTWGNGHGQWVTSSGIMLVGEDHVLKNSAIEYSAGNGASLFGRGHRVLNNIIHDVNYAAALASGIYISESANNAKKPWIFPTDIEIAGNTIYRGGWGLVDGSNLFSTDREKPARIHHNFFDAPGLMTKDVGACRFVGHRGGTFSEPPLPNGTRVDHNFVRGCVSALGNGIYLDFNNGYVVDHNVVWHSVNFMNLNDAGDIQVVNNTGLTIQGGIGGNIPGDTNAWKFKGVTLRNNLSNQEIFKGDKNTHETFKEDHNLAKEDLRGLFVNSDAGDFRLKAGAKAIDAGFPMPPLTEDFSGKAPDQGAFEFGGEDWSGQVGARWALEKAPSGLKATAVGNGTATLEWQFSGPAEEGFIVERGYKTDHPNGEWEYLIAGRTATNQTRFVDHIPGAYRDYFYRVRTTRSCYSEAIVLKAGIVGLKNVSFEAEEGFTAGRLAGQMNWVGLDSGRGPGAVTPETFQVITNSGNKRQLEITGPGNVAGLGNMTLVDPKFNDGKSKLRFSFRVGFKKLSEGNKEKAIQILIGGLSHWQGPEDALCSIEVQRDGLIKWAWQPLGKIQDFAANPAQIVTVSGILNLAAGKAESLSINGKIVPGEFAELGKKRAVTNALWQINSGVTAAESAVSLDDLTLELVE